VAATRARHLLVLGWRADERHSTNPLATWLLAEGGLRGEPDLPLQTLDPADLPGPGRRWTPPAPRGELQGGPLPRHRLDTSWGRSSYSSWAHAGSSLAPEALEEGRDTGDDDGAEPTAAAAERATTADWERLGPLAHFPRGTGPGEVMHRILERLDYRQNPHEPEPLALIRQELERAGLAGELAEPLAAGLERVRLTPAGGALGRFRLAELAPQERLNEMNFDLPLAVPREPMGLSGSSAATAWPRVRAAALARCFHDHPGGLFEGWYGTRLATLDIAARGFLTGSIDLVFRRGARWWVLDWKSNWLGERDPSGAVLACGPAHYGLAAMAELMASSHYPLQAHLYLVALHRYLRWRLPDYDPRQHLGGYVYVFLRGLPGATATAEAMATATDTVPGMLVERAPLQRLLALDALLRDGTP
jgi:exodeoxyribonuclease V beta subunit